MFFKIKLYTHAKLNFFKIDLFIRIKTDLALNNLQRLICHKTQPTNQPNHSAYSTPECLQRLDREIGENRKTSFKIMKTVYYYSYREMSKKLELTTCWRDE